MNDTSALLPAIPILAGAGAGAWLLRRAWRSPDEEPRLKALGWSLIAASIICPAWLLGGARGPFIAVMIFSVAALVLVASGAKVRAARERGGERSLAPEPFERPSTKWRGVLRWLLAGPIGMIAAMAVGIAYAVWVPGEPQTRLVIAGLMVPVLWGGAMAWTLADNRILRATAVLAGVAVAGFAVSILRGFA